MEHLTQFAQGDVLITRVRSLPDGCKPINRDNGRVVLAYGEVTGHAHAIAAPEVELLVLPQRSREEEILNVRFLNIMASSGVDVTHEEHGTIHLDPGIYEVRQQREWADDMEPIRVAD